MNFAFEIWERESAPADYCLIRRLSMDASCPSLPPKILVRNETDAELRPNAQTTAFMAAHGCHFVECCLFVLLVIIEVFFLMVRESLSARTCLYKLSIAMVSRTFSKKLSTRLDLRTSPPVACRKSFDERLIGASGQNVSLLRNLSRAKEYPVSAQPRRSLRLGGFHLRFQRSIKPRLKNLASLTC